MENAGFKVERELMEYVENAGKAVKFKKLDGSEEIFSVENVYHFGHTTKSKVDLVINPNTRLQVKSSKSNRASVINMVPIRNWEKLAKREMMDILPVMEAITNYKTVGKRTIKLSEIAIKSQWIEIINYFLFEGTSTYQAEPYLQANYLVQPINGKWLLITKKEAIDHIWEKLTFEIRTRKNKIEECVHVRISQ